MDNKSKRFVEACDRARYVELSASGVHRSDKDGLAP